MIMKFTRPAAVALTLAALFGAATAVADTVEGSVAYRDRMAPPPDAVLELRLLDISRMDVAADTLSMQRFALDRVPFAFSLSYDPALIDPRMRYSVQAVILSDGQAMFRSTQVYPVLTADATGPLEMVLDRMPQTPPAATLDNTGWEVFEMRGRMLIADRLPAIRFGEDGEFSADGTCNRFVGQATVSGASIAFPEAIAGTRMACPDPYGPIERDFTAALADVTAMVPAGHGLSLVNAAGVAVMRLRPLG